jgi:hypothetical protein
MFDDRALYFWHLPQEFKELRDIALKLVTSIPFIQIRNKVCMLQSIKNKIRQIIDDDIYFF